jgi:hypothetical protein
VLRIAWYVFSRGSLPGGGENLCPPFAGHLPQGLALKPFLKVFRVHLISS